MRLPRHCTVVAYLALFASVSTGGAFAAIALAPNSVGSAQIKSGAIRLNDISPATRAALVGPAGPAGLTGASGPKGDTGAAGSVGTFSTGAITIREQAGPIITTAGEGRFQAVDCALGERALGGGGAIFKTQPTGIPGQFGGTLQASVPSPNERGWYVTFGPDSPVGGRPTAYVVCLKP